MIDLTMVGGLRLPEHSHCRYCGDPIRFGQEFCDDECRAAETARVKTEKRKEYLFWGSAAVVCIIIMAIGTAMKLL